MKLWVKITLGIILFIFVMGIISSIYERTIREQELIKDYGFSPQEADEISNNEATARDMGSLEELIGFSAGAFLVGWLVNLVISKIRKNKKKEYVYRCQHCKKTFDTELEAKEHLKHCKKRHI